MDFYEVLDQVVALLRTRGRVTYRALKLQFHLDDEQMEALKEELIEAQRVAADEDGKVLVWVGEAEEGEKANRAKGEESLGSRVQSRECKPVAYTPRHLAERIRAEQVALEARGSTEGERKTITALFADLKGSTALLEGLDPEEARALIDPALQRMMDAVHRYEGYVAHKPWGMASSRSLARPLPMKTIPSGPSMPPCVCKKKCGAIQTRSGRWDTLHS